MVQAGRTVQISVSGTNPIARVSFVKNGSTTHGFNMEQRFVDLPFNASGNTLSVQIPARASDIPPGMWMMFAIDSQQYLMGYLPVVFFTMKAMYGTLPTADVMTGPAFIMKGDAAKVQALSKEAIR